MRSTSRLMGTNWRRVEHRTCSRYRFREIEELDYCCLSKNSSFSRKPAIGSLRNPATYESPSAGEELMEGADNNVSILQLQDFKSSLVEPLHSDLIVPNVVLNRI